MISNDRFHVVIAVRQMLNVGCCTGDDLCKAIGRIRDTNKKQVNKTKNKRLKLTKIMKTYKKQIPIVELLEKNCTKQRRKTHKILFYGISTITYKQTSTENNYSRLEFQRTQNHNKNSRDKMGALTS